MNEQHRPVTDKEGSTVNSQLAVTSLPCGACGVGIEAAAPVINYPFMLISEGSPWWFPGHICLACAGQLNVTTKERPETCEQCARPVYFLADRICRTRRILCSKRCENRFYRTWRTGTQDVLWVTCVTCEQPFQPKRIDAQYCSNACRQRLYRRRRGRMNSDPRSISVANS